MRNLLALTFLIAHAQLCLSNDPVENNSLDDIDQRATKLMTGMYEIESWNDGTKLNKPPTISGRWSFLHGKTMAIIHNRIDSSNQIASVGWGYGHFSDGKFKYAYPEFITVQGEDSQSTVKSGGPFEGEREYNVKFDGERMVMTSKSGKQVWEVTPNGMRYTDQEWGVNKGYAQRVWKRISRTKQKTHQEKE